MIEKTKTTIKTDDVIYLSYLDGIISREEINEFEKITKNVGLQFSCFDKSGIVYNCLDQYTLITSLLITQPLIGRIMKDVGSSAIWDAIKYVLISIWKNTKNKTYQRISRDKVQNKELTFGLEIKLDKNTSLNFKLSGDFDEKIIDKSLDKILKFLKDIKPNEEYQHPKNVFYNPEQDEWTDTDFESE